MPGKLPSKGFFLAASLAALAIVGAVGVIVIDSRYRSAHFSGPVAVLTMGLLLMFLTFAAENHGSRHKGAIVLRNTLIVVFAIAIVLVLLLAFLGPFH